MNRTALAFIVLVPVAVCAGVIAEELHLSSWAATGVAVAAGLLVTLIDREGFYGSRVPKNGTS